MGDDVANDRDLEERLRRLSRDLGKADGEGAASRTDINVGASEEMLRARSKGFRILGEFTAAIIAALVIGYAIDHVAGTSPAFLIIFLILGMMAGFWNIYRAAAPPGVKPRG